MIKNNLRLENLHSFNIHEGIMIIELEEFLAWRVLPTQDDLYLELQNNKLFKKCAITAHLRTWAAAEVRKKNQIHSGHEHASLNEIYEILMRKLDIRKKVSSKELIKQEIITISNFLSLDHDACSLIERTYKQGFKVYLITDLEFNRNEIIEILDKLDPKIKNNLSGYFTPCELKTTSFTKQLSAILESDVFQDSVVNYIGKYLSAKEVKESRTPLHYYEVDESLSIFGKEIFLNRNNIAAQILPDIRYKTPLTDRSRHPIGLYKSNGTWHELGYKSIGPILYDFSNYIKEKITNHKCHIAFLMRDGYLPMRVVQEACPDYNCGELSISRFTAISSSIRTEKNIVKLIYSTYYFNELTVLLKLLNLTNDEQSDFIAKLKALKFSNIYKAITEIIIKEGYLENIIERSKAKAQRLKKHIYKNLNCKSGDNVALVDLGYAGTVQNYLMDIASELELNFSGLYLITDAKSKLEYSNFKDSLINTENNDPRIVHTLLANISLLEMACSAPRSSTIDYDELGDPITSSSTSNSQIPEINLSELQQGVMDYCRTAENLQACNNVSLRLNETIINLARYLYAPTKTEIALFENVKFDLDMGSNTHLELFNADKLKFELENFGFHNVNNSSLQSKRFHLPYEMKTVSQFIATNYLNELRFNSSHETSSIDLFHTPAKIEEQDGYGKTLNRFLRYPIKTFNDYFCIIHTFNFEGNSILLEIPATKACVVQINDILLRNGSNGKIINSFKMNDQSIEHNMINLHGNIYSAHDNFLIKTKFSQNLAQHVGTKMLISVAFRIL